MAKQPNPFQTPFSRRSFIRGLSLGAATLAAAGCGAGGGNDFVFTGGAGVGGGSFTEAPGGVVVNGLVNLADFGNVPLTIRSLHQKDGKVAADGSFSSKISDTSPQLLFIVEPSEVRSQTEGDDYFQGKLRGFGLALPKAVGEAALAFGAESTAVAMVFGTIGILTINPVEALSRISRIKGLPSYAAYRDYVGEQLKTKSIGDLGEDPTFLSRKSAVISEFSASSVSARQIGEADLNALQPQGFVRAELGDDNIAFENNGFRYVRVWRHEVDSEGNTVAAPLRPRLANALTGGAVTGPADTDGIIGGANQAGWGNLFTGQTFDPAGATDNFTINDRTAKVEYYLFGPGRAGTPLPPTLPAGIPAGGDKMLAYALTIFFYGLLPFFDLVSGNAAGEALHRLEKSGRITEATEKLLEKLSDAFLNTAGVVTAANGAIDADVAASRGDAEAGLGNQNSAYIDFGIAIATTLAGLATDIATALALASGAAIAAPAAAVALIILGGIAAVGGAMFAATNFSIFLILLARVPSIAKLEVGTASSLERLGTSAQIEVLGVNDAGALVYNREGKLYLRQPSGGAEVLLLDVPGDAKMNSRGDVLFQARDRQSPAKLRPANGAAFEDFPVPDDAQSEFATGLVGITPEIDLNGQTGVVPFAYAVRADGKTDIYYRTADGIRFGGAPEGSESETFFSAGVGSNVVAGRTDGQQVSDPEDRRGGFAVSTNARFIINTGTWRNDVYVPTGNPRDSFGYFDINDSNEILAVERYEDTSIEDKAPGVRYGDFLQTQSFFIYKAVNVSTVFGPSGQRSIAETVEFIDEPGVTTRHSVVSLNNDGEVVGTLTDTRGTFPALWRKNGEDQTQAAGDIRTLFPSGSPTEGDWSPTIIRGKFIVMNRVTDDGVEIYLFNRGR